MLYRSALALAFLAIGGLLSGCIFSPDKSKKPPGIEPPKYVVNDYPDRVLTNLVTAYTARDSVGYRKLFDYQYEGSSKDLTDGTEERFFNNDEVEHIQAFARATTITSVVLDLGPESSWTRQPSDDPAHPEWAVIQISGSNMRLIVYDIGVGDLTVQNNANTYTYKFAPTTPASSSLSDTLWTLIRWEEVRNP